MFSRELKNEIDAMMLRYPDVLSGIANIYYSPYCGEFFSAVMIAVPYEGHFTPENYMEPLFDLAVEQARSRVCMISSELSELMQQNGLRAWIPSSVQRDEENLKAEFSFKFGAVNAGIGWIGKNDVLVTRRYGPRVAIGAVLTDIILPYDDPIWQSQCPESCEACMKACPDHAIYGTQWNIDALRKLLESTAVGGQEFSDYPVEHDLGVAMRSHKGQQGGIRRSNAATVRRAGFITETYDFVD